MVTDRLTSASSRQAGLMPAEHSRRYFYERVMQVSIRNTFYNASGFLCPDFQIRPTSYSADLMKSIGLLFKDEGTGFSVLLDTQKQDQFLGYLRSSGPWTRLSFLLTLQNPNFLNFTNIPINMTPGRSTFFLSNTNGTSLLAPSSLKPLLLTGSQYMVSVPGAVTQRVIVRDLSGEIVECEPVYWPRHATLPPNCDGDYGKDVVISSPADLVKRDPVYLDFSALPEDKYRIERCGSTTGDCLTDTSLAVEVVYAHSGTPLIFLDLFFTDPGFPAGAYPVSDLGDDATVVPVQYSLDFTRRSTVWNYYILSTSSPLSNLRIEASDSTTFTGPNVVTLPGNQPAAHFISDSAIALQEQSDARFKLLGDAAGMRMKNSVLLDRLPVASQQQIFPGKADFATSDPNAPVNMAQPPPGATCFSDIYVYV